MKKQTMYNHLQKQYAKLNLRIQKAMQTGRFYAYTQFKQEQLLSRLKRCSFQLKQLGAGVAVVAALGMATPAVGQPFVEKTGTDNPFDGFTGREMGVADLDGDGDLDCFFQKEEMFYPLTKYFDYYENVGTVSNPSYILQTGANDPLDGINDEMNLTFVDIDNDGDLDCFGSSDPYYGKNNRTLSYYENTSGSATTLTLTLQTAANNPLNLFVTAYGTGEIAYPTFVDIDNDGDMDCFIGYTDYGNNSTQELVYYENTGTASSPTYVLGTSNLTGAVNSMLSGIAGFLSVKFEDMDNDGDLDAYTNGRFLNNNSFEYYDNIGTVSAPSFLPSSTTAVDNIPNIRKKPGVLLFDIDNDMDLDVVYKFGFDVKFWQNDLITSSNIIPLDVNIIPLGVSPNPTTGELNFDKSVSGKATVYSISGQLMLEVELSEAQTINLERLQGGLYFLEIQTEKGRIREKVILQK